MSVILMVMVIARLVVVMVMRVRRALPRPIDRGKVIVSATGQQVQTVPEQCRHEKQCQHDAADRLSHQRIHDQKAFVLPRHHVAGGTPSEFIEVRPGQDATNGRAKLFLSAR